MNQGGWLAGKEGGKQSQSSLRESGGKKKDEEAKEEKEAKKAKEAKEAKRPRPLSDSVQHVLIAQRPLARLLESLDWSNLAGTLRQRLPVNFLFVDHGEGSAIEEEGGRPGDTFGKTAEPVQRKPPCV